MDDGRRAYHAAVVARKETWYHEHAATMMTPRTRPWITVAFAEEPLSMPSNRIPTARVALATATLLSALALLTGCGGDQTVASLGEVLDTGAAEGYNVLLVTIDTARRDRYGCYGDQDARTPSLDALAADGVRFADAVTSVPLTLPSHTTLLTGLYPPSHGVHDNGVDALGPEPSTLAEVLSDRGYATGAFVGAFVLDARFGLDRGFDTYDFTVDQDGYRPSMPDFNERSADTVTDAALAWLSAQPAGPDASPFFAWLHYFDPHLPYTSPLADLPEFRDRPYDAEIAFADQQLQRLIDWLERSGQRERTLVVVTSDHGEALGEHGELTHGMFIYEGTMAVPLVMSCPSLIAGPVVHDGPVVGLVDLRPTIEDLLGIASDQEMDGLSLLGDLPADRTIYMETAGPRRMAGCAVLHGLRSSGNKYIQAPESEYYDLLKDPAEEHNLFPQVAAELGPWQDELLARLTGRPVSSAAERTLTDEEMRRLGSLGYTISTSPADSDTLPDPKWRIRQFNDGMKAQELYDAGQYDQAARLSRQVIRSCPDCLNATRVLAFSELRRGNADTAIAILEEAVERTSDTFLVRSLAQAMIIDQEYAAALDVLDLYEGLAPDDGRVPLLRGDIKAQRGNLEGALRSYRQARDLDPHRTGQRAEARIEQTRARIEALDG